MSLYKKFFIVLLLFVPMANIDLFKLHVGSFNVTITEILLIILVLFLLQRKGLRIRTSTANQHTLIVLLYLFIVLLLFATGIIVRQTLLYVESSNFDVKVLINLFEIILLVYLASEIADVYILRKAMMWLLFGSLLIVLGTILKSLGLQLPGAVRMSGGFSIGPFVIGVVAFVSKAGMGVSVPIIICMPFLMSGYLIKSTQVRIALLMCVILASGIAYSRASWIAILVEIIVFFSITHIGVASIVKRWSSILILISIGTITAIYSQEIIDAIIGIRHQTVDGRIVGYIGGLHLLTSGPFEFLFGPGKDMFYEIHNNVPHNFLLEIMITFGMLSFILFISMFTLVLVRLNKLTLHAKQGLSEMSKILLTTLIGFFTLGLLTPMLSLTPFWVIFAVACSVISISQNICTNGSLSKHQNDPNF